MAARALPIDASDALLRRVEALALEGYSPADIARRLNVRTGPVHTRFKWLRELKRLPPDWRPSK